MEATAAVPQIITREDAAFLAEARDRLADISKRCNDASYSPAHPDVEYEDNPYEYRRLVQRTARGMARVAQAAAFASDAAFDVLNTASSYADQREAAKQL